MKDYTYKEREISTIQVFKLISILPTGNLEEEIFYSLDMAITQKEQNEKNNCICNIVRIKTITSTITDIKEQDYEKN